MDGLALFYLFSVCEKLSVPSCVEGFDSSWCLHGSYGCALHDVWIRGPFSVLGRVYMGLGCTHLLRIQVLVALSQCTLW